MIGSSTKSFHGNAVNIENARTKTDYFTQKLGEANNYIKETWKISNSALGKRSKTSTIHKFSDNNVSDPIKKIPHELNSYFCNIVEDILKDSDNPGGSNALFEPYISKFPKSDSLCKFERVTPNDIVCRSGKVPTRFLKDGLKCIAHVLFWLCSYLGIFQRKVLELTR